MIRFILLLVTLGVVSCTKKEASIEGFIFEADLFGQCHASTLVQTEQDAFLAAWFAGAYEGADDVAIWGAFYREGHWLEPFKLADGTVSDTLSYPCWNPVLFNNHKGVLFLYYKVGPNPREWEGRYMTSSDKGHTWSEPATLPSGVLGPIKNKPESLGDGTFLAPSSVETLDDQWRAHLELFSDDGTFIKTIELEHGNSIEAIQPSLLKHSDKRLQILCRSRQNRLAQSWSTDGGQTWEPMRLLDLPNPNSGTDAVTLKDGRHLLVFNPLKSGSDWWQGRNILHLAVSDNGIDWETVAVLENHLEGEYSYPAIIQDESGRVHITYTWDRKRIKHVVINPEELGTALN
jgi:alpha-L-fucosidase